MRTAKNQLKQKFALLVMSGLFFSVQAIAATDLEAQESFARARSKRLLGDTDHSAHQMPVDKSQEFHGIFYGYVPCDDCDGVKTTLSLKQKNNYLIVIQPAKESNREFYEKGKYEWNEAERMVVLTPKKAGEKPRRYFIEDEGTLIQLDDAGMRKDGYVLQRSDTYKSREVHIH